MTQQKLLTKIYVRDKINQGYFIRTTACPNDLIKLKKNERGGTYEY